MNKNQTVYFFFDAQTSYVFAILDPDYNQQVNGIFLTSCLCLPDEIEPVKTLLQEVAINLTSSYQDKLNRLQQKHQDLQDDFASKVSNSPKMNGLN